VAFTIACRTWRIQTMRTLRLMTMEGSEATYYRQNGYRGTGLFGVSVLQVCRPGMCHDSPKAGGLAFRFIRAFMRLLAGIAFLGMVAAVAASKENPQASAVAPAKKPHPPLFGKACVDCHKQQVSERVRCLVAKEPMCVFCHDIPDVGGTAKLVNSDIPLCLKCHEREKFKGSYNHGPFVFGACVACHNPHGGSEPRMLRVSGRQVCLTCHRDLDARLTNAGFRHQAMATGCTECHSPHASEQRYELKEPVPVLCFRCHEKIYDEQRTAEVKHSPVTETRSCLNCHNPHLSQVDHLLVAEESDTCLGCHDEPIKVGQYELERIGQLLAANPRHHGPLQSKECSGCHKPHGSANFRLLTDPYPNETYTPFEKSKYDLCFRCHESTLVTEERTTTLTGFRDGDRNLHFVHVDKAPRGRTCGLCHQVHASTLPKHIGVTVRFGEWNLPLGFVKTETGGSCSPGCHSPKKYERKAG
jgi:predicted CXXCH cytochrome family protein